MAPSGCWEWTGSLGTGGYGRIVRGGRRVLAHRAAWVSVHGAAIPDGLVVSHSCDNRACVKPGHLVLQTQRGNNLDMLVKGRNLGACSYYRGCPLWTAWRDQHARSARSRAVALRSVFAALVLREVTP